MKKKQNKKQNIKQIIVVYVTSISVSLGIVLTLLMIIAALNSTSSVLHDSLRMAANTSSQNISSNLHLLTDRMDSLIQETNLSNDYVPDEQKQQILDKYEQRIEFVWIAAYDESGRKLYGDEMGQDSIAEEEYYEDLVKTGNMTIGKPHYADDIWQLSVGTPLYNDDGNFSCYLVGSYRYDLLNDVLSNINIGAGGLAYLVDREGNIIANKNVADMEKEQNIYDLYSSGKNKKIFDSMLDFQSDSASVLFHMQQHYIAYSPVAGTNWTLMIAAPGRFYENTPVVCSH